MTRETAMCFFMLASVSNICICEVANKESELHATACKLFGLYEDGIIFRWAPIDDEYLEISANAGTLTISHDGNFWATGDRSGRVKIYSTANFELIYQLPSKDCVFGITSSPDTSRFYDIHGQDANVWEPSALMRLSEQMDRGSDSASHIDSSLAQNRQYQKLLLQN